MSETKLTVSEIKDLMDKMAATGLTGFNLQDGDYSITLKSAEKVVAVSSTAVAPSPQPIAISVPAAPAEETGNVVKSPIVGTFYAAASPEKPAFATVGKAVTKGDVLFIIESMKLMNEVQSDFSGTVKKILVENGQAVEYGQPILVIE